MNVTGKKKAHIFNIDNLLIRLPQKVWIIEKNNPNECLLRIPKEDFDLIKTGMYKDNKLSMTFNGRKYWLSKDIFEKLQKSVRKLASSEELSFSFREYTNPETIQDLKVELDLSPIEHLKNLNDDLYFISTKGTERKYGKYYTQLIDKLKEDGVIVNQVYYLNQSYFSQSKDQNIKKICYVLVSNLLGKDIKNDKIGEDLNRNYSELYYYDTNYVTINKIDSQINSFLKRLKGDDKNTCKLFLNLVGSNLLNPFTSTEVKLNKYIQTFENFIFGKKKISSKSEINYSNVKDFLDKNGIEYTDPKDNEKLHWVIFINDKESNDQIQLFHKKSTLHRSILKHLDNKPKEEIEMYFYPRKEGGHILENGKTLKDLVDFISKYMPQLMSYKVIKKINENEITDQFRNYEEGLTISMDFLDKNKIPYVHKEGSFKGNKEHHLVIDTNDPTKSLYFFFKARIMTMTYVHTLGTSSWTNIDSVGDIIYFISKNVPELINTRVFKQINENNLTNKFSDIESNLLQIKIFLSKNNIDYHFNRNNEWKDGKTLIKFWYTTAIYLYGDHVYDINVYKDSVNILFMDPITRYANGTKCYTIMDVIKYLSEKTPSIASTKALKKINENDTDILNQFGDIDETLIQIKKLLDKSGIEHCFEERFGWLGWKSGSQEWYYSPVDHDGIWVYDINVREDHVMILYMDPISGDIDDKWCNNIRDVIEFISEKTPDIVPTEKVLRKINENIITEPFYNHNESYRIVQDFLTKNKIDFTPTYNVYDDFNEWDRQHRIDIENTESGSSIWILFSRVSFNNTITSKSDYGTHWEIFENLKNIIDFISLYDSTLITNRIFKQINK